jgi:hypothetical protein
VKPTGISEIKKREYQNDLYHLGPNEKILPEDGDRIQSLKYFVLKNKQDGVFR